MTRFSTPAWIITVLIIILFNATNFYHSSRINLALIDVVQIITSPEDNMFTLKLDQEKSSGLYEVLTEAIVSGPNKHLSTFHLAQLSYWSGELDDTVKILDNDLHGEIYPLSDVLLGYALWQMDDSSRAIEVWRRLPNSKKLFSKLALSAETRRDFETMRLSYKQLLAMDPVDTSAQAGYWYAQSNLLVNKDSGSLGVEESVGRAFQYNYENYSRLLNLGKAMVDSKSYNLASPILEQAVVLDRGNSHWASYYLGLAYYYQNRYELAETTFLQVIQVAPDFGRGYHWLARTLVKMERPDEAQIQYEEAVRLLPDDERLLNEYHSFLSNFED
jgi:tetratricopeptide (TPR) repeat protein